MPLDQEPAGRVALITGAAGEIGRAVAHRLAADEIVVVAADLSETSSVAIVDTLPGAGHVGIAIDVADERSVVAAFDRAEREVGPVTILVTLAAILSPQLETGTPSLVNTSLSEWNCILAVNATGTFLCVRELARRRQAAPIPGSRIVTLSSGAAQQGGITSGIAYSGSKGAVLSLTKSAARELAPLGFTVNCVAPGPIDTPMLDRTYGLHRSGSAADAYAEGVPLRRVGQPEEIADAVSFLVSSRASFITGATLDVNGGVVMR